MCESDSPTALWASIDFCFSCTISHETRRTCGPEIPQIVLSEGVCAKGHIFMSIITVVVY